MPYGYETYVHGTHLKTELEEYQSTNNLALVWKQYRV